MPTEASADDREQIEEITAAWEAYDRTRDVSAIADYLAEDVVIMPPGDSAVAGKVAVEEWLDQPVAEGDEEEELPQWIEEIHVSGKLAVVHAAKEGTRLPDDGDEPVEVSYKGLDVYRRSKEGEWKQIISIWNDQA